MPTFTAGPCRSGLASRKGRAAAPDFSVTYKIAGAAPQPFRDARPLLQGLRINDESGT
ncbi:hypothetical protein PAGU2196_13840 [Pseudomonas sp. PAGU 2196]|nr:hypothetical protein PAGU2196_13840 [Pseudomonas sp. PAGU 2196]